MLQYLIQVLSTLFPPLVFLGTLYGFLCQEGSRQYKRYLYIGFLVAFLIAMTVAALRLNTRFFVREYYHFFCLLVAVVGETGLIVSLVGSSKDRVTLMYSSSNRLLVGIVTIAGFALALPDLFLFPFEFAIGLDSFFQIEVLYKVVGYFLSLALSGVGALCIGKVMSRLPEKQARNSLVFTLVVFVAGQFAGIFHILMLRSSLMQNEALVNVLLLLLEHQNTFVFALLLVVLSVALLGMVSAGKTVFSGANPALVRKKKAESKRTIRWSVGTVLCVVAAMLILTVAVEMSHRTVELSPPVELPAGDRKITVPLETVNDGHLHRFSYTTESGTSVRYIIIRKSESSYGVALDACDICGASGYYERNGQVVCILCDVVMNIGTIGMPGGCNPVPLDHEITGASIVIDVASLEAEAHRFE